MRVEGCGRVTVRLKGKDGAAELYRQAGDGKSGRGGWSLAQVCSRSLHAGRLDSRQYERGGRIAERDGAGDSQDGVNRHGAWRDDAADGD